MNPLKPAFTTLTPAISHIAQSASTMSSAEDGRPIDKTAKLVETERQRQLIERVLQTPNRLRRLLADDKTEAAAKDWRHVSAILEQWKGVAGADTVRIECESIMQSVQKV